MYWLAIDDNGGVAVVTNQAGDLTVPGTVHVYESRWLGKAHLRRSKTGGFRLRLIELSEEHLVAALREMVEDTIVRHIVLMTGQDDAGGFVGRQSPIDELLAAYDTLRVISPNDMSPMPTIFKNVAIVVEPGQHRFEPMQGLNQ